jgi:hypothetical protein
MAICARNCWTVDNPRVGGDQAITLTGLRADREPLSYESPEGVITA